MIIKRMMQPIPYRRFSIRDGGIIAILQYFLFLGGEHNTPPTKMWANRD
jgi:hypothetical protein